MKQEFKPVHGMWASRWVFILAATGSAVGLGNIWKFPYITGEYGGGAFVLLYLVCIAVVGIPIMVAEVMLGRKGGLSPIHSMQRVAQQSKVTKRWGVIGYLGALSGFLLLSFYTVIAGWSLYYVWEGASGVFQGASAEQVQAVFADLKASPWMMLLCHTLFMAMTMGVVARGVNRGLEKAVEILMPVLFVLLIVLVGYAATTSGFADGMRFLFAFDFSKLSGEAVVVALGHSFFTLSLGLGAIMAYGAYMPHQIKGSKTGKAKPVSIGSTVLVIAVIDTLVALAAGMAIFPLVFSNGLEPSAGPGLMFESLPLAFGQLPGGALFSCLFFILVACAAWSSSISLGEPLVAWLVERGWKRWRASLLIGALAWVLGIGTVLSFNIWKDDTFLMGTFFDNIEFISTNIMLPLGGLLIAVFAGWIMKETQARKELAMKNFKVYMLWRAVVRIFSPAAVIFLFGWSMWSTFGPEDEPASKAPPAPVEQPQEAAPSATVPGDQARVPVADEGAAHE
ncbi:SNF family Na(+)-dependent transporter [Alcanivorax hongdengensis A-11-3]|uniref:Transporter n=1 Tax=Alcanivorax hongdengensis A-11-3 TaxID=1177179 RepID=L0WGZ7_9GAMM|nr:sodium-dependent transporter [Alcanivorax hongdengensis]EKF75382.1 SNF family Na(+)-dependent transporter [Alcanivorax hongdengensis A-11-3]